MSKLSYEEKIEIYNKRKAGVKEEKFYEKIIQFFKKIFNIS